MQVLGSLLKNLTVYGSTNICIFVRIDCDKFSKGKEESFLNWIAKILIRVIF